MIYKNLFVLLVFPAGILQVIIAFVELRHGQGGYFGYNSDSDMAKEIFLENTP